MLDNGTRLRRLRNVVMALAKLDPCVTDLRGRVATLKKRADLALQEEKLAAGNQVNLVEARLLAKQAHRLKGSLTRARVLPIIEALRTSGFISYRAIAEELNRQKVRPPAAKQWSASAVHAIEKRPTK